MAIDMEQLNHLNCDYTEVTGKPVRRFVCPITLQDDPDTELCNGHVLNGALETASRTTVIQRKDVDGYFVTTIESDLIRLLNAPISTPQELLRHARDMTVTLPSGETSAAFFANKKARAKFQQIDLLGPDGKAVASPFLRSSKLEPKLHKGLQVEWLMVFTNSAVLGTLLKSAYLALFRLLGYRWVFSAAGDKVRRSLAEFYTSQAGKEGSVDYFSEYNGAFNVLLNGLPEGICDTLNDRSFWLHFADDSEWPILFAQTCLFKVNSRLITITLPATEQDVFYFTAYVHYETLLRDRSLLQKILYARYENATIQIDPRPLHFIYAPKPQSGMGNAAE